MVATIRELRSRTKELLSAVERGETIWITNRGKRCAKITPIDSKKMSMEDHPAFGMWKNREDMKDPSAYIRKMRRESW